MITWRYAGVHHLEDSKVGAFILFKSRRRLPAPRTSFPYEKQMRAPDAIEAAAGLWSWRAPTEASVSKTGLASMSCLNEARCYK